MRAVFLIVLALALAWATPAHAAFPGANGALIVTGDGRCESSVDLMRTTLQGGRLVRVTDACRGKDATGQRRTPYYSDADVTPGGRKLLVRTNAVPSGLATIPVTGGKPTEVPLPAGLALALGSPSLSPDGKRVVAEVFDDDVEKDPIVIVTLKGGTSRELIPAPGCADADPCSTFASPRWSPDGKLIAVEVSTRGYKSGVDGLLRPGIWLISATTGRPVRRVAGPAFDVDWSPDGKRLVFRSDYQQDETKGGASGGNLYVVRRDGTGRRTLVHREDLAETQPAWSPDGKRIAWVSLDFGPGDAGFSISPSLWSVPAGGGKPQRIRSLPQPVNEEGFFTSPELAWQPKP